MSEAESHDEGSRRDFLYIATGATAAVVTGAAIWPVVDQMNPAKDVLALASVEVDIADVSPGTQISVMWRGKPVFLRRRTEEEIQAARDVDVSELKDQIARNPNLDGEVPATDENRALDDQGEWLVQIGVCTHLGCIPIGDGAGDFGGWFCPCHGSHYDTSGRIRLGPATENLHIPTAEFISDTVVKLG